MTEKTNETASETLDSQRFLSKRHRGVVLFLLILAVLAVLFFCLWRFLERPAIGTIRLGKAPSTAESFDTNKEKKHYLGKYVDFSYPALYLEKRHDTPTSGPIKESVFLSADNVEGRKIALVLANRGTNDLESDPSFQMRMNAKGEYQSKSVTLASFRGTLFQKNTSLFEVTAFFLYQGNIVSISITSPFGLEGLEADLLSIVESLHFSLE